MRARINTLSTVLTRHIKGPILAMALWPLFASTIVNAQDQGIHANASYIADSEMWTVGHKSEAEYHYRGTQMTVGLLRGIKSEWPNYRGPFLSQTILTNSFERGHGDTEPSRETLSNYTLGYEIMGTASWLGGVQFSGSVSVENAYIKLSGPEPVTQRYHLGYGVRCGIGYGPYFGSSGFYARIEYQAKYFTAGRDDIDTTATLRDAQFQTFTPVFGVMLVGF